MFVVIYHTESGDSGLAGLFTERPTEGHLTAITLRDMPDEITTEDGVSESCCFYTVYGCEAESLPEPVTPIPTI